MRHGSITTYRRFNHCRCAGALAANRARVPALSPGLRGLPHRPLRANRRHRLQLRPGVGPAARRAPTRYRTIRGIRSMKIAPTLLDTPNLFAADAAHQQALGCLYEVIDPELGINIVDLGLVYTLDVEDGQVRVEMTMTTPACPLHAYLTEQV